MPAESMPAEVMPSSEPPSVPTESASEFRPMSPSPTDTESPFAVHPIESDTSPPTTKTPRIMGGTRRQRRYAYRRRSLRR